MDIHQSLREWGRRRTCNSSAKASLDRGRTCNSSVAAGFEEVLSVVAARFEGSTVIPMVEGEGRGSNNFFF
ncbi:hypothetical protein LINPERHAP1_LOCUS2013 [Linum perenne]